MPANQRRFQHRRSKRVATRLRQPAANQRALARAKLGVAGALEQHFAVLRGTQPGEHGQQG